MIMLLVPGVNVTVYATLVNYDDVLPSMIHSAHWMMFGQ